MPKKIKLIKPTGPNLLTYTCPPGYAARLELVGGIIPADAELQVIDLATNVTVWSVGALPLSINSDAPLLGERYSGGSSSISIPPEYIAYTIGERIQGIRKIWYLDGGAVGEKFMISSLTSITARILVIEEDSNFPALAIKSITPPFFNTAQGDSGGTMTFDIAAVNYNGSTLYWFIRHGTSSYQTSNSDFQSVTGNFTVNSNVGSFTIEILGRGGAGENNEYFRVEIREQNSLSAPVIATSPDIIIYGNTGA